MNNDKAKEIIKVKLEKFKIALVTGLTAGTNFGYQLFIEDRPMYWEVQVVYSLTIAIISFSLCFVYDMDIKDLIQKMQ